MKANKSKKHEGIQVCDLKISILEMKKHYEVHFIFENNDNVEGRMDTAFKLAKSSNWRKGRLQLHIREGSSIP